MNHLLWAAFALTLAGCADAQKVNPDPVKRNDEFFENTRHETDRRFEATKAAGFYEEHGKEKDVIGGKVLSYHENTYFMTFSFSCIDEKTSPLPVLYRYRPLKFRTTGPAKDFNRRGTLNTDERGLARFSFKSYEIPSRIRFEFEIEGKAYEAKGDGPYEIALPMTACARPRKI